MKAPPQCLRPRILLPRFQWAEVSQLHDLIPDLFFHSHRDSCRDYSQGAAPFHLLQNSGNFGRLGELDGGDATRWLTSALRNSGGQLKEVHFSFGGRSGWRTSQAEMQFTFRGLHVSSEKKQKKDLGEGEWLSHEERKDPRQEETQSAASDKITHPTGTSKEVVEEERIREEVYKGLKKYVHKKYPNRSDWMELVDDFNPTSAIEEPAIVDLRPENREPPPLDRVTIPIDTPEQFRVTRKTKWMVKQLRSPVVNDVHTMLEQWVKTMYPRRSDWLDLMKEFSGEKDRDLMFQIFEFALLDDTFEVRTQDLTKLLMAYINLGRYDDVERVMETLDSKGFPPDFVVCTVLLDLYCKLKKLDKARGMFDQIRSLGFVPDIVACSALVEFYCQSGNPEAAELVLGEIVDEKVHFGIEPYISVLRGYGRLGQVEEAHRIFDIIDADVFLKPKMDKRVFCALMDAYVQAGNNETAVLLLEEILSDGLEPEDQSVALLIAAHEKNNHFEKALDVLLKLESKAIRPGVETLTSLISWFGRLGLVEEAEALFNEIEKKREKPECKTYVNLYATYARAGLLEKARSILESVKEKGILLTDWAFEQMIQGLLAGDQLQEAQSMRDQMQSLGYTPSDEIERALLGVPA